MEKANRDKERKDREIEAHLAGQRVALQEKDMARAIANSVEISTRTKEYICVPQQQDRRTRDKAHGRAQRQAHGKIRQALVASCVA